MIPTDFEFLVLYVIYGAILALILWGLRFRQEKVIYLHLFIFVLYAALMIYLFLDKEHFKGGASLGVLLYGYLFPGLHVCFYGIIVLITALAKNSTKKTL